jgi:hypothetical protein
VTDYGHYPALPAAPAWPAGGFGACDKTVHKFRWTGGFVIYIKISELSVTNRARQGHVKQVFALQMFARSTAPIARPTTSRPPAWRVCTQASAAYHNGHTG